MKFIRVFLLGLVTVFSLNAFSQVTSVPEEAKKNFERQYPGATNVKWDNDIINVNARFELNGDKMNAEYSNKGIWRFTIKDWTYEQLPTEVKEGFKKSKYADRTVGEVKTIYYPGDVTRYRIKAEKNDLQKKYLYFSPEGRLIRDSNTL